MVHRVINSLLPPNRHHLFLSPMRESFSTHNVSIHARASDFWPRYRNDDFRPNLNIPLLTEILSASAIHHIPSTKSMSKRKAVGPSQAFRKTKRVKTSEDSRDNNMGEDELDSSSVESESELSGRALSYYPLVRAFNDSRLPDADTNSVAVLRHVLEIRYSPGIVCSMLAHEWNTQDEELSKILFALSESLSSPQTIELGEVQFAQHEGRIIVVSRGPRHLNVDSPPWLLLVPSLTIDEDSNDFRSPQAADILSAIQILQAHRRACVTANLRIQVYPQDDELLSMPKFSLELEFVASIILPTSLDPVVHKKGMLKKDFVALEDAQRRLLRAAYLPEDIISTDEHDPITISIFYSIMGPAPPLPSQQAVDALQPEELLPTLLPFQRRSVAWLLEKEGMSVTAQGTIIPRENSSSFSFWEEVMEGNRRWYLNRLSGELSEDEPELPTILGGMLAEEPGLGKTVETIALILLNPAPPEWNPSLSRWDPISRLDVKAVKSTLIVTPPALAPQWREELETHAPTLKVLFYEGWTKVNVPITNSPFEIERLARTSKSKKAAKKNGLLTVDNDIKTRGDNGNYLDWCDYVQQFDVVITTYAILRSEIHVARPGPERLRREDASYSSVKVARSPLVMVEWKRVVMDEVQMVGGGQAAEMVSFIPRLSSLAVSGTPAKAQMSDLIHVLKFLRVDQILGNLQLWRRLLKPGFSEELSGLLRYYGIRTMKSNVKNELTIPQQTRYLVGIELGKIERHVYDEALEGILHQLGLDARGVAASAGWQVDGNLLRTSLRRLRGICTHPQVGQLQRKTDGLYKPGALKTMDAVLQTMRDLNWRTVMIDWQARIQLLIRWAQLQQKDDSVNNHYQNALRTLDSAEKDVNLFLDEIRDALAKHDVQGQELKESEEAARLRREHATSETSETANTNDKGKGKATQRAEKGEEVLDHEDDPEDKGLPKTSAGEEHRNKRTAFKQRLREGLLILHRVKFLQGDVLHVLGDSSKEDAAYEAAEKLRRQLLQGTEDDANKAVTALSTNAERKNLTLEELLVETPLLGQGGIRSMELMEEANTMIEEVLNEQSNLIWKWRTHLTALLTKPLNPEKDETADGQEYQRTLDDQGEAETYLQVYAALLADRREALVSERTLLAAHDAREKKLRQTHAAMKAAGMAEEFDMKNVPEGLDIQPEHEVLHKTLSAQRRDLMLGIQGRCVKSVLIELNAVGMKIFPSSHPEKAIVDEAVDMMRGLMRDQAVLHEKLEADLALLRKAFNQRILYFRQLQEISDSVAEVEWEEETVEAAIQVCVTDKASLDAKMNTARARQRYLENLSQTQDNDDIDEDDKACILCRCDFTRGYITQCAHVFCELCMKAWLLRKGSKSCPVCRVAVDLDTVQRFTVNAVEKEPPPRLVSGEPVPQSHRKITYNTIDESLFSDIQMMETYGDYGSKIQTLIRHLAHLKITDPGAKSIVFSAWADSLHIVDVALRENGIPCLRIDQGSANGTAINKFRKDPNILVLLLHGERENAGLNITCASRVFLLESVVHHSFEIQAIARIDRLGQTRPTEVYCYYAEDTVERNILDLAARKGLSLYTKENAWGTVSVSAFAQENDQAVDEVAREKRSGKDNKQRGDFIYKVDDMLAILFPHMFEDVEYLLPTSSLAPMSVTPHTQDVEMRDVFEAVDRALPRRVAGLEGNAVAGPSRLR